jgi:hypothetical protein
MAKTSYENNFQTSKLDYQKIIMNTSIQSQYTVIKYFLKLNRRVRYKFVTTCFSREADENWALSGYYEASSGEILQTFRDNLSVQKRR